MDEIQRVLIKQGRKDLAQKYYEKTALKDKLTVKVYEVYRDNWNVGKLFSKSDANKMIKFFKSLNHAEASGFEPNMKITDGHTYLTEKELENLKRKGVKPEILDK